MSKSRFTHSGNILLVGFGMMIVMMSALVYMSMKQDIHMVSKDYYEQELVYQQKINAMAHTHAYDKQFSITENTDTILIKVPESLSKDLNKGSIYFYCPADEKMDKQEVLAANANGVYSFPRNALLGKKYIAKISMSVNDVEYYKELKMN
jgi:nitrogen fixation protein FixH